MNPHEPHQGVTMNPHEPHQGVTMNPHEPQQGVTMNRGADPHDLPSFGYSPDPSPSLAHNTGHIPRYIPSLSLTIYP